jgi:hypothetical protein
MTVVELAGRHCEEVVVCAHVRPDWPHTDPNLLCLEATLLVLEDPAAAEEGKRQNSQCLIWSMSAVWRCIMVQLYVDKEAGHALHYRCAGLSHDQRGASR